MLDDAVPSFSSIVDGDETPDPESAVSEGANAAPLLLGVVEEVFSQGEVLMFSRMNPVVMKA